MTESLESDRVKDSVGGNSPGRLHAVQEHEELVVVPGVPLRNLQLLVELLPELAAALA